MRKQAGAGGKTTRGHELRGEVPKLATVQDLMGSNPPLTGRSHAKKTTARSKTPAAKINIKAVSEALIDAGLDPATEIARILRGRPILDDAGNPVIDPLTGEQAVEHLVDPEVRLRTLNSLLEFVQPKMKSVDVKMSGSLELTDQQLDQRLNMLLSRAMKADG